MKEEEDSFKNIYIPLCLYFNTGIKIPMPTIASFTFHYVSILIESPHLLLPSALKFTFHYVSILIQLASGISYKTPAFTFHYVSILIQQP